MVSRHIRYRKRCHLWERNAGNHTAPSSALQDLHTWNLLKQYLLTDMTYPEMDDALVLYLGDQYSASDWEEARHALFSGDSDIGLCLKNLDTVMLKHIPPLKISKSPGQPLHKRSRVSEMAQRCILLVLKKTAGKSISSYRGGGGRG